MAHHSSLSLVMAVIFLWVALVVVGASSMAADQPSATIVAIEGASTTYRSIDRHGKVVTVQVPSQSAADIRGADAQGQVHATVTAIDTTTNQVKVQTPAGQTIVLAMPPAALRSIQIGDPFTFTVPARSRIVVRFTNGSPMMPHGAEVVRYTGSLPLAVAPSPAFPGAASPRYRRGTQPGQTVSFSFIASRPGRYLLICPVHNHVRLGHWDWFVVSSAAQTATATLR